mgnify:CR=1 FL=1
MEEEKKLPKNIRQMAEKEERVRVYLEDYAYTFIRKLNCTGHVRTGILLGSKMVTENKRCWFVKGAVELEDAQGSTEEENEQKTAITQQVWDNTLSVIQEYFPGCSICGWFISGTEENFPDGEELKKTHRQIFSGENCLMYWKKGDEESFWMEEEDTILHLKGYFVYYEKNNELFHTEHPFVKGLFIKVPLHSQDLASVRKWYKKNNQDAIENLEKYSLRNAVSYDYFYDRWLPLSDIAVKIPLKALDTDENYLDKNRNIEVKDTAFCYFLHVEEFLGKDEQRPLDFARKEIKEILINLKRVDFINKVKEELYQRASDRNKINYYYLNSNE